MGRGCDPPSERPARWHPEGCPCIDTSTRPAPACHPRATRGPAHNQVSATAGSPPPARWSSFYGHRRKRQAGPERGRPQARKPSACTRHARAPVASLDMPQPRDRCVRKSNIAVRDRASGSCGRDCWDQGLSVRGGHWHELGSLNQHVASPARRRLGLTEKRQSVLAACTAIF